MADARLPALFGELPAVMVTGPGAAGKTTSARRIAAEVLRLDDPAVQRRSRLIRTRRCGEAAHPY